jgi:hypothetical protein
MQGLLSGARVSARGAVVMCLTAIVLSGCGGGSRSSAGVTSTPTATSASTRAATGVAPSTTGGFITVVPPGFTDATRLAHGGPINFRYLAVGPRRTNINVVREPVRGVTDMNVIARAELRTLKRILPKAHGFSPVATMTVGGYQARSVDYLNSPAGQVLHQRQIFVAHGGWVYVITYTALPTLYAAHLGALNKVIAGWRWT